MFVIVSVIMSRFYFINCIKSSDRLIMAKPNSKEVKPFKRDVFHRKAKVQSAANLEKLAVMMEVIEASISVEDVDFTKEFKIQKKRKRLKRAANKSNHNSTDKQDSLKRIPSGIQENEDNANGLLNQESERSKKPVLRCNAVGLSHFMELGERTDLLYNNQVVDPLGPDSFDDFQWVQVKQELPDDLEVCKVTLTDLPLKIVDVQEAAHSPPPEEPAEPPLSEKSVDPPPSEETGDPAGQVENNDVSEEMQSENDNWDHYSSLEDSDTELHETETNEEYLLKKKRKNHPQDCDICGKRLSSKGNLRLHKLKKHKQKVQFTCNLCGLKFDFQRDVVQHRNSTHRQDDGRFCCDICTRRFSDYHRFVMHIKSHLTNGNEEKGSDKVCKQCEKTFQDDESLKIHQTLTHNILIDEIELREKLKHQEKNFICHTCGKRFAFNCLLRDHINLHTGSKPYLCQKCGKSFSQKATLKQHTKTHNDIRPFQCSDCPLGFYGGGDLKKHIRKHTGERPYVCEVCGEGFSQSSHLGVHRRSHTGERPYSCDVCERGFTKRGDVVRHRRIHTGELPYLCQVCGKAFRQSTQCANHIKSQHPDTPAIVARNPNPLHQRVQSQLFC